MLEDIRKVYKESILKYPSIEDRVDIFKTALKVKSKEALKVEKSDPQLSENLDSFVSGMRFAYSLLRAHKKDGWTI